MLPFLLLVAVLVTVHEAGHWYAARMLGIDATHFSVGLGRVLVERVDRNGCRWQLRAWPVGGFVRFLGDEDAASVRASDGLLSSASAMPEDARRRHFALRSPGDKAYVLLAGPLANLLLGFALASAIYVGHGRPYAEPVVRSVLAGSSAAEAGILPGDRVETIDGRRVSRFSDVQDAVTMHPGSTVVVGVRSPSGKGRTVSLLSRPVVTQSFGTDVTTGQVGMAGGAVEFRPTGVFQAMSDGVSDVRKVALSVATGTWQVATGARPLDQMGGPVRMAQMSGNAARQGFLAFVVWTAVMSVNLGVVNLVPIPVLDGGGLVVCAVEWATGRRASDATMTLLDRGRRRLPLRLRVARDGQRPRDVLRLRLVLSPRLRAARARTRRPASARPRRRGSGSGTRTRPAAPRRRPPSRPPSAATSRRSTCRPGSGKPSSHHLGSVSWTKIMNAPCAVTSARPSRNGMGRPFLAPKLGRIVLTTRSFSARWR